jgi:hypothetical protein
MFDLHQSAKVEILMALPVCVRTGETIVRSRWGRGLALSGKMKYRNS